MHVEVKKYTQNANDPFTVSCEFIMAFKYYISTTLNSTIESVLKYKT